MLERYSSHRTSGVRALLRYSTFQSPVGSQEVLGVASTGGEIPTRQVGAEVVEVHVPPGAVLHSISRDPDCRRAGPVSASHTSCTGGGQR